MPAMPPGTPLELGACLPSWEYCRVPAACLHASASACHCLGQKAPPPVAFWECSGFSSWVLLRAAYAACHLPISSHISHSILLWILTFCGVSGFYHHHHLGLPPATAWLTNLDSLQFLLDLLLGSPGGGLGGISCLFLPGNTARTCILDVCIFCLPATCACRSTTACCLGACLLPPPVPHLPLLPAYTYLLPGITIRAFCWRSCHYAWKVPAWVPATVGACVLTGDFLPGHSCCYTRLLGQTATGTCLPASPARVSCLGSAMPACTAIPGRSCHLGVRHLPTTLAPAAYLY